MDYYLIFGMVTVALIAIIGFLLNIRSTIKQSVKEDSQPIQDLNLNIAKLNANFEHMLENDENRDRRIQKHGEELDALKEQQEINIRALDRHELRIGNLEEKVKGKIG